jgi:hypothetical protein
MALQAALALLFLRMRNLEIMYFLIELQCVVIKSMIFAAQASVALTSLLFFFFLQIF